VTTEDRHNNEYTIGIHVYGTNSVQLTHTKQQPFSGQKVSVTSMEGPDYTGHCMYSF